MDARREKLARLLFYRACERDYGGETGCKHSFKLAAAPKMTAVKLFATCLAEEFFPSTIEATKKILEDLKLQVIPLRKTFCCGQAPFNEGLREEAVELARGF